MAESYPSPWLQSWSPRFYMPPVSERSPITPVAIFAPYWGTIDKVQHAGNPVLLVLNIKNKGPAIPNYAIVLTGLQHWLIDDVTSTNYS